MIQLLTEIRDNQRTQMEWIKATNDSRARKLILVLCMLVGGLSMLVVAQLMK